MYSSSELRHAQGGGRKEERGVGSGEWGVGGGEWGVANGKWKMELEVPSVATTYIKSIAQLNPLFHLDRDIFVMTLKPFLYGKKTTVNHSTLQYTTVHDSKLVHTYPSCCKEVTVATIHQVVTGRPRLEKVRDSIQQRS